MQQLGFSLDAVALMDVFEDDTNVHLVSVWRSVMPPPAYKASPHGSRVKLLHYHKLQREERGSQKLHI